MQEAYCTAHDAASKELRNTMLAVLAFLTETPCFCDALLSCGALALLANAATTPGLRSPADAGITPFSVRTDAIAHEQYRLLWSLLAQVCVHSAAGGALAMHCGLMRILLLYVDLEAVEQQVRAAGAFANVSGRMFQLSDIVITQHCVRCIAEPPAHTRCTACRRSLAGTTRSSRRCGVAR